MIVMWLFLAVPRAVYSCDCGISWSYSLFFFYSLNIFYCQNIYSNGVGSQVLTTLVSFFSGKGVHMYEGVGFTLLHLSHFQSDTKLFHFIGYLTSESPLDPPLRWPVTISLSHLGHFYEGFDVDIVVNVFFGIHTS